MESRNFEQLREAVTKGLPLQEVDRITRTFRAARENGEVLSLSAEEVGLLESFRRWVVSPGRMSNVFHWPRKK